MLVDYSRVFRGAFCIYIVYNTLLNINVYIVKEKCMSPSCPISTRRVDSNMVRIISFQVVLFSLILLIAQESVFALILFFDFFIRAVRKPEFSPFHIVGQFVLTGWGIAPKLCDESPKRFALYLGLVASLFLAVSLLAGFTMIATFITAILLICALLETVFDFCIGCKIYYAIQIGKGLFNNDRNLK